MRSTLGNLQELLEKRFKEHLKAPCLIYEHSNITGHHTSVDNISMVEKQSWNLNMTRKVTIFIRVNNDPSLTSTIDKCQLSHIWDEVMFQHPSTQAEVEKKHLTALLFPCHCFPLEAPWPM